jgi:hypothetical protein
MEIRKIFYINNANSLNHMSFVSNNGHLKKVGWKMLVRYNVSSGKEYRITV